VEIDKRYKSPNKGSLKFRNGQSTYLWVKSKHLRCRCPKIRPNASYLILDVVDDEDDADAEDEDNEDNEEDNDDVDNYDTYDESYDYDEERRGKRRSAAPTPTAAKRTGLTIKKKTLVMEWKKEWRRRMKRFKRRSKKFCPK
jgi:hypothetical protein